MIMFLRKIGKVTVRLVQLGCVVHCIDRYVGSFVMCCGDSMVPTLFNNDIVLAENISVAYKKLQKGDIVIARSPADPYQFICKRLVAMEGDSVFDDNAERQYVPKGHVWLEGDNQRNSNDSCHYGPVPAGLLNRRVFFRIWPFPHMGYLKHPAER
ncbi:mitochondrial inner membrane protease subunit 1-like [Mytilus californianus]|uniref:mitochondrial inner membrane protease subunit 1-like n=1 Tax=Mytilus californianus TaxID=6549 RepID=UPI0022472D75|nr:mitochondrial inner membrane protease subunit 1-like [Mytilus californianus]